MILGKYALPGGIMLKYELDNFSASFVLEKTELLYRNSIMSSDRRLVIIGLLIFCVPSVVFAYSDFLLFGFTEQFYYLIFIRSFVVSLACLTIYLFIKTKNIKTQDWILFSTVMLVVCSIFYINLSRPSDYFHHSSTDILSVFALYWIIPNRYYLQIIPAITMSLFNIYVFIFLKDSTSNLAYINFWFSYIFVNVIGLWISWTMHIYRRRQFANQLEQIALTEKLQVANDEIRTLQGILPLCSGCKKIRDDKGYWSQIDAYIEANTDTQFSHGMCSSCIETLYGEQEWYRRSKKGPDDFTKYSS